MRHAAYCVVPFLMVSSLALARVPRLSSGLQPDARDAGVSQQARPQSAKPQAPATAQVPPEETAPTESALGLAPGGIYPGSQFITSYDAGQGQRYYLFGANAAFEEVVAYYRGVLKDKGDRVFDEPAVHQFDIGRFREETMAFPPSITVKDYTWGGMGGYLNPRLGAEPPRFKTVIQIVPSPATTPVQPRR